MAGIAGWTDYSKRLSGEGDVLKAMTKKLTRGSDASEGTWVSEHTLLGASEAGAGGEQPAIARRGDEMYILVYSGELYNRDDIIRELRVKGHELEVNSDAHAILHAYIEWGEEFLSKLNGIFALAIRDAQKQSLFLARDRLGVKPLFYNRAKDGLIFASELKALLAHPFITARLSTEGLAEIFAVGPARTPGSGVLSGICELLPGTCMRIDAQGVEVRRYWSLTSYAHEEDFEETISSVRELVFDAVRRQIKTDDKLAFMLSGGLDSSAICAIAQKELGGVINTLSLDYVDNDKNFRASKFQPNTDAPWVLRVTDFLRSSHETCMLDTPELTDAIFEAVHARSLPGMTDIDSSLLLFSRWIKERAGVAVSGECADELFGGYPWFYRPQEIDTFPWAQRPRERIQVYSPELIKLIKPEQYVRARYEQALSEVPALEGESSEEAHARKLSYLTITRWLPTLLDRQDRMSAYAGLTLRAPFSDYRLAQYMWNVPWSMKYRHSREKGLLRHALRGILPDDVLWRKKSPFPKTHNPDYIELLRIKTLKLLADASSPLLTLINKEQVKTLAETMTRDTDIPWFGQLMNAPQLLAYLLQVDFWLREYNVSV